MTTTYDDAMSMGAARQRYFDANGFDGAYAERWVKLKAGPIAFYFPNAEGRRRAVKFHDLHHIATGYQTDWTGEAEISAWEIASGCGRFGWAWFLNLSLPLIQRIKNLTGIYLPAHLIVSLRTVSASIRGTLTLKPMPGASGALIVPRSLTVTGGSMMSSSQYRALAETSPGKVKPASVDIAMLCARPIPDSSMPPHQTGISLSRATCSTRFASA